jgi:hypothetical protein
MATVPNVIKDISRAVATLEESYAEGFDTTDDIERVAANLAYTMGKNVNLRKLTGTEVAYVLASHGFTGDLRHAGNAVARRVRALADEYGKMTSQL